MSGVVDFVTGKSGEDAATAARDAAAIGARGQEEALAYLKETEALPQHYREQALSRLAGLYGIGLPAAPAPAAPGAAPGTTPATATGRIGPFGSGRLGRGGGMGGMIGRLMDQLEAQRPPDTSAVDPYADLRGADPGLPGHLPMGMSGFMDQVKSSPLYAAILGTRKAGEEGLLRTAAATGGLRSGTAQANLYDFNQRLQERALLEGYQEQLQGLRGLAGLPSMAPQIAQATAAPAMTTAQGITAGAQAQQANTAGMMQGLFTLGGAGLLALCDSRLKKNVRAAGTRLGLPWYEWEWNDTAEEMYGLSGPSEGVMAHEVARVVPNAVMVADTGHLVVDYGALL